MKFGLCANLALGNETFDGQTIKSQNFYTQLCKNIGTGSVLLADTNIWKQNPILLFLRIINLCINCDYVIIMPDHRGIFIILPITVILTFIFGKKLLYVVVGGWLAEFLDVHKILKIFVRRIKTVFVEANMMKEKLINQGFRNVAVLHNFKNLPILTDKDLSFNGSKPFSACIFSRIMKEKGIELAIKAIKNLNTKKGETVFILDIWGKVEPLYRKRFESLIKDSPSNINYRGVASPTNTCDILKNYTVLLFPTFYESEGFAGTILDAFAAGLPVVASDWKYNREIVKEDVSGFICRTNDVESLTEVLEKIANDYYDLIPSMKINCLAEAENYRPDKVISEFLEYI